MEQEVKRKVKAGTPKTEALIGQGVVKMETAIKSINQAVQQFAEMPKMLAQLSAEVADKQDKIAALNIEFAEKKRQHEVELELQKKAGVEKLVTETLQAEKKVAITAEEHLNLKQQVIDLQTSQDKAVDKAVAIATNSLKSTYEADKKVRESEYVAKEAENKATINSLNNQIATLNKELDAWKKALDEERKASVERAKAASIGAVNISGQGK